MQYMGEINKLTHRKKSGKKNYMYIHSKDDELTFFHIFFKNFFMLIAFVLVRTFDLEKWQYNQCKIHTGDIRKMSEDFGVVVGC